MANTAPATRGYRGLVLTMLLLVYTFNFLDRQILGILVQPIKADLGLTDTQLGALGGTAFALLYSTLAIPFALLADRTSRSWVITAALTIWSGFTALCGIATGFGQLFLFRLGVGVGDALCHGGAIDVLARYFEYWLMRLEGVYPSLDVCPRCGRPSLGDGAVLVVSERAYVCESCAHGGPHLSSGAVALLRGAGSRTPRDVGASAPPASLLREIEQVHHVLIAWHLEKELRSARVVRELRPA